MKVTNIKIVESKTKIKVLDSFVDNGYLQGNGDASLPDVDCDFQSDRRQEVKEYLERRYNHDGKQRVFSAGTFTTLKVKAVLKDVCRVHHIPSGIVNYITAMFDDDKCDWTGIFKLAYQNKKIYKFVMDHPDVFEEIRTLMYQPRSSSIHASALIITPDDKDGEDMECFDFLPIKRIDNALVSEIDGYSIDEIGLLKNDVLGIKELSKLQAVFNICNKEYGTDLTLKSIVKGTLDDPKVYDLLRKGYTQNVFQFSSKGMTKFLMDMKPNNINDLIAANALFRPATLDSGSTDRYVDCKNGDVAPEYLWGTYNIMKGTFGILCYQEDLAQIAQKIGGFSLAEGVKLVKFISKKKQSKIDAMKDKFMAGALKQGCPKEDAVDIWKMFEVAGGYLFNKSHATAYGITAYAGAYLKANYPTAFYTVALQWCDDDEIPAIMSEMESCSKAKIVPPDINVSGMHFQTNYQTDEIFWSLLKIKMLGTKAVQWIIDERDKNGDFTDIGNFINRVFKYKLKKYEYWDDPQNAEEMKHCPVNARHILNLILAGCFDKIEKVGSLVERYAIVAKASSILGFEPQEKDFPTDLRSKHYFWSMQQIKVSSIGSIDYRRVFDNSDIKKQIKQHIAYADLKNLADLDMEGKKIAVCATVIEIEERKYKDKKTGENKPFCKIQVQQNNEIRDLMAWNEDYTARKVTIMGSKNKLVIFTASVKYSEYDSKNTLQLFRNSIFETL